MAGRRSWSSLVFMVSKMLSMRTARVRRLLGVGGTRLAMVAIIGCASSCTAMEEWTANEPSPTGGVTMSLSIARPAEQAYELYRVTRLGALEYGGGLRAFNDSTNWSGALSESEIREFLTLLDEVGWCHAEPEDDPESTVRVRIELRCTDQRHTWNVRGMPPSVVRMRDLFEPITRRRFEQELDRLPEPSEVRMKERDAAERRQVGGATAPPQGEPATERSTP